MARILKDGSESPLATFSVRLPKELAAQIDERAVSNHRSRNGEIQHMLEAYMDLSEAKRISQT